MEDIRLTQSVKIEFKPQEMSKVVDALKRLPYDQVANIIESISSQIREQIKKPEDASNKR